MYDAEGLNSEMILRWNKLLEYDFFRIYSQHLILFAPSSEHSRGKNNNNSNLPKFRKNVYTWEIIEFILKQIESGEMTKLEVMQKYRIPKTTLYKWIQKYRK